jgi:hypothetical protein
MQMVSEIYGHKLPKQDKGVMMGLELEMEQWRECDLPKSVTSDWNLIHDHSLRDSGVEFVHKAPLHYNELIASVYQLGGFLDTRENLQLSHRCALHCHIDCRDMNIEQIESLYRIYVMLEPALYNIGCKDRYENIYCPGFSHATEQVKQAGQAFSVKDVVKLVNYGCKYTGFNFLPLQNQGSVEIRTHQGTASAEDVIDWVKILQGITLFAKEQSLSDVKALAGLMPDEVLQVIFDGDSHIAGLLGCPALYTYWENAKLNLLYLDLIDEMLLTYVEPTPQPRAGVRAIDTVHLDAVIMNELERAGE